MINKKKSCGVGITLSRMKKQHFSKDDEGWGNHVPHILII